MAEKTPSQKHEFDEVFTLVRTFGPYQIALYFWLCFLQTPMSLQFQQTLFAFGSPQFHCTDANTTCPPLKCCENCTNYQFDGPFTSTVSEWNLLCDRAYLGAAIQSSYFVGMLFGSLLSGWFADAWGRKTCIFLSAGLMVLFGVCSSFADCISLLILLRFCVGFALAGVMLTEFVYIMEMVGPEARTHVGKAWGFFWKIGAWVSVLLSYFVREWRYCVLFGSLVGILIFFFWKVIPETARWLLANERLEEAHAVLCKCGPKDKNSLLDREALRNVLALAMKDEIERRGEMANKRHTPLDLVRTPKIRRWTLITCYNWFVVALVFFGFELYTTQLPGSIYFNYFIMNLIDIPIIFLVWFLVHRFGRRIPFSVFMLMVGICSFIVTGLPSEYSTAITVLAILGRSFVWNEFCNVYLMTTELFPTVVRNTAMGLSSMCARVGALLSPFIVMVAQLPGLSITLPVTIFGVLALVSALATLWLPETIFATMHQTIEEAEAAKEDFGIPCLSRRPRDLEMVEMAPFQEEESAKEKLAQA